MYLTEHPQIRFFAFIGLWKVEATFAKAVPD